MQCVWFEAGNTLHANYCGEHSYRASQTASNTINRLSLDLPHLRLFKEKTSEVVRCKNIIIARAD